MPSSSSSGDELHLTVTHYGHIEWRGSRARLEASGLIPPDFEWPRRIDYSHWRADGFDFLLRRCRPDGLMDPMQRWMNCDYWFMRRTLPCNPLDIWFTQEVYRDLGDILSRATRQGEAMRLDFSKVHADERIEMFDARLVPQPMKGERGTKAK